jgi:hypothetical protein
MQYDDYMKYEGRKVNPIRTNHHFKRIQADHSGVQWGFYSAHDMSLLGSTLPMLDVYMTIIKKESPRIVKAKHVLLSILPLLLM